MTPTIRQLVRKGRAQTHVKTKSPALQECPQGRGAGLTGLRHRLRQEHEPCRWPDNTEPGCGVGELAISRCGARRDAAVSERIHSGSKVMPVGRAARVIDSYFAPYNHKPTSTNVAVLELGEPEQLIEIQMVAVVD